MKTIAAYVLTDTRTKKFYVGSTGDIEKRLARHFYHLRRGDHHCPGLQYLWNNGGMLIQSVFPVSNREEAYILEQDVLDRNQDSPLLLNIVLCAKGGDTLTRHPNREERIAKMCASLEITIGALTPLERKILYGRPGDRNGMFGRTHTEEARKKFSEINLGNSYARGFKWTDDSRRKMSEFAKTRLGERNAFFGQHHSDDTKARLSQIAKARDYLPGNSKRVTVDGTEYVSLTEASRQCGISPALMVYRLNSDKPRYSTYQYVDECPSTIETAAQADKGVE
jgi:group I intron endonuclease